MSLHPKIGVAENRLLAALPSSSLTGIESRFERVSFAVGTIVHDVGEEIEYIYFPTGGIASLQIVMEDGRSVDTTMLGCHGALGLAGTTIPFRQKIRSVVRSSLPALKISAVVFGHAIKEHAAISALEVQFTHSLLFQAQVSAARYALLSIDARLAACLLEASDLLSSHQIALTHEIIAEMLAASRTSITQVAFQLQALEIIRYSRGVITILDRKRLSRLAHEIMA
jgi:CRP-like cAMP-binding protein